MRIDQFSQELRTGELVRASGSGSQAIFAFLPDPLPPSWPWPESLWPLLLKAHTALASLDGTGKHLAKSDLLWGPLQSREAQLSSQLEGTVTEPHEQALFQAAPSYPESEDDPKNSQREVFNYRRALRIRVNSSEENPLSLGLIREFHSVLMDGVRGSDQNPGQFRTTQNQIGRPARFVPPPPEFLTDTLQTFEVFLRHPAGYDPLVNAFLAHYQFETIHPFADGNGRVGRLLLACTIKEWCGLAGQWLYMSAYFEAHKQAYMDLLLAVSTQGAWHEWIEFCLLGVVEQARDTERRCEQLLGLYRDFHERLSQAGGNTRLMRIVDELFDLPVVQVARAARDLGVSHPTARSDLKKLESLGILKPLTAPGLSNITYFCPPLLYL